MSGYQSHQIGGTQLAIVYRCVCQLLFAVDMISYT